VWREGLLAVEVHGMSGGDHAVSVSTRDIYGVVEVAQDNEIRDSVCSCYLISNEFCRLILYCNLRRLQSSDYYFIDRVMGGDFEVFGTLTIVLVVTKIV